MEKGNDIEEPIEIDEYFPDEQMLTVDALLAWYADIVNCLACNVLPLELNPRQKKKFLHDVKCYQLDDPRLFHRCVDQVIWRCISEVEHDGILSHCHFSPYGGHMYGTLENISEDVRF